MDIAIKHIRELFDCKQFRVSGFENSCNIGKQISTGLEIEIKFKIVAFYGKENCFYMMLQMSELLIRKILFKLIFLCK